MLKYLKDDTKDNNIYFYQVNPVLITASVSTGETVNVIF